MINTLKIYMWPRKGRAGSKIYCRIFLNSKRAGSGFSTGIELINKNWDSKRQIVRDCDPESEYKNKKLALIRSEIQQIELQLMGSYRVNYTAKDIEDVYLGKKKVNYSFLEVMQLYLKDVESRVPALVTRSTADTYASKCKNIKGYFVENKLEDIGARELRPAILDKMRIFWSSGKYNFVYNHISKHLEIIRQIMKFAIREEYIDASPIVYIEIKKSPPRPIVYLTEPEINRIAKKMLASERLKIVRDTFLIQCFTGFSYAELATFLKDPEHYIKPGIDDEKWIFIQRGKIKKYLLEYSQPVMKNAQKLLQKHDYKIKILSNQKYNEYLKEIARVCKIHKHLTTHVARKTYGMLLLNNGVPMETVSKLLGHTSIRTTERIYAKILEYKIASDIKRFETDLKLAI